MGRKIGTISKKTAYRPTNRKDKYEYTRRNNMERAQMNLDKIFIAKFKNISIKEICRKLNISPKNGVALRLNARDIHRIKVELDRLIREIYDIKNYEGYDLSKSYTYYRWGKEMNKQIENGNEIILAGSCYDDELTES